MEISYPPEDLQIQQWKKHLVNDSQDGIVDLVEDNPMHLHEIDFVCGQAAVRATMLGRQSATIDLVTEIFERYRSLRESPILFGAGTSARGRQGSAEVSHD